jgi:hypothetical protein
VTGIERLKTTTFINFTSFWWCIFPSYSLLTIEKEKKAPHEKIKDILKEDRKK